MTPTLAFQQALNPRLDDPLLESIRQTLNTTPQGSHVALVVAGLLALVAVLWLAARFLNRENAFSTEKPQNHLRTAVEVLGLSDPQRGDIERIAELSGIQQPVSMLLSPANLARATELASRQGADETLRGRMEQLCAKLFDAPFPTPETPARRDP